MIYINIYKICILISDVFDGVGSSLNVKVQTDRKIDTDYNMKTKKVICYSENLLSLSLLIWVDVHSARKKKHGSCFVRFQRKSRKKNWSQLYFLWNVKCELDWIFVFFLWINPIWVAYICTWTKFSQICRVEKWPKPFSILILDWIAQVYILFYGKSSHRTFWRISNYGCCRSISWAIIEKGSAQHKIWYGGRRLYDLEWRTAMKSRDETY